MLGQPLPLPLASASRGFFIDVLVYRHSRLRLAFGPPAWPVSATPTALTTALCQRATTNRCAAAQTEK